MSCAANRGPPPPPGESYLQVGLAVVVLYSLTFYMLQRFGSQLPTFISGFILFTIYGPLLFLAAGIIMFARPSTPSTLSNSPSS